MIVDMEHTPFKCSTEEHKQLILSYLGITEAEVGWDRDSFFDKDDLDPEDEEWWSTPAGLEAKLSLGNVHSSDFSYGLIELCVYKGKKVVLEQNASPIIYYFKK